MSETSVQANNPIGIATNIGWIGCPAIAILLRISHLVSCLRIQRSVSACRKRALEALAISYRCLKLHGLLDSPSLDGQQPNASETERPLISRFVGLRQAALCRDHMAKGCKDYH